MAHSEGRGGVRHIKSTSGLGRYAPYMAQEHPVSHITAQVRRGEDIGRALGNFRRLTGVTQAEFGERVGITRSRVAQIEAGLSTPLLETELKMLRMLGATVTITWSPAET